MAGRGIGARPSAPRAAAPPVATANTSSMRPTGGSVTNAPQCAAAKPPSAEKATSRMTSDSVVTAAAA